MDSSQANRLLTWLDEEHRKDKALLVELQSQVNSHGVQFTEQARQLQSIQATLTRIEGQLPRIVQLEEALQGIRGEFASILSKHAAEELARIEQRSQSDKQASETLARALKALQERVDSLGTFEPTIAVLRDEDSKLRAELTKAFNQATELTKTTVESRSVVDGLSREIRIVRDELETLRAAHEDLSNLTLTVKPAIDNVAARFDARASQLETALRDAEAREQTEMGAMQRNHVELTRQIEELASQIRLAQAPLTRWSQQLEEFAAQFETHRKTLYDLHELEQQLRQQGTELLDLQRVHAERQRAAMREWQDSQVPIEEQQTARLEQLEAVQKKLTDQVESIRSDQIQNQRALVAHIDDLWRAWADYAQAQSRLVDSVSKQRRSR